MIQGVEGRREGWEGSGRGDRKKEEGRTKRAHGEDVGLYCAGRRGEKEGVPRGGHSGR